MPEGPAPIMMAFTPCVDVILSKTLKFNARLSENSIDEEPTSRTEENVNTEL